MWNDAGPPDFAAGGLWRESMTFSERRSTDPALAPQNVIVRTGSGRRKRATFHPSLVAPADASCRLRTG